jgi:hypothetical protein
MKHSLLGIKKLLCHQRGAVVIWFALLLPVLLGLAALAIDLARLSLTKAELQNAADAAALGGARSLSDPGGQPYNWTAAEAKALELAQHNIANAEQIQNAVIETGYWNLDDPSLGLRDTLSTPVAGDVAAVRARVAISSTQNNGPLPFFFAPILGIDESDVEASAIAILPAAAGGTGLFPFVIKESILEYYWDTDTNSPKLAPSGQPYSIKVNLESYYPSGGEGTWSSLNDPKAKSSDSKIGAIITGGGNVTPLSIGDDVWIATGTMQNLYQNKKYPLPIGKNIAIPVVTNLDPGSSQPIVAIAGFKITGVGGNGNKSYLTGNFIFAWTSGTLYPGSGTGTPLGAYAPPVLVK